MKVTNPNDDRAILACIVDEPTGEQKWYEIPAGESVEHDDYVVASTLVEHGAVAAAADLQAARQLWAEQNRDANSRTASAAASEGEILQRRQATVDVATGSATGVVEPLAGPALAAAVKLANDSGATISTRATAGEKREALAAWQAQRGSSTPVDGEFLTDDDGELVLDDESQPYRLDELHRDESGALVYGDDGRPVLADSGRELLELPDGGGTGTGDESAPEQPA